MNDFEEFKLKYETADFKLSELASVILSEKKSNEFRTRYKFVGQTNFCSKSESKFAKFLKKIGSFENFIDFQIKSQCFVCELVRKKLEEHLILAGKLDDEVRKKVISSDLAFNLRCSWEYAFLCRILPRIVLVFR